MKDKYKYTALRLSLNRTRPVLFLSSIPSFFIIAKFSEEYPHLILNKTNDGIICKFPRCDK